MYSLWSVSCVANILFYVITYFVSTKTFRFFRSSMFIFLFFFVSNLFPSHRWEYFYGIFRLHDHSHKINKQTKEETKKALKKPKTRSRQFVNGPHSIGPWSNASSVERMVDVSWNLALLRKRRSHASTQLSKHLRQNQKQKQNGMHVSSENSWKKKKKTIRQTHISISLGTERFDVFYLEWGDSFA